MILGFAYTRFDPRLNGAAFCQSLGQSDCDKMNEMQIEEIVQLLEQSGYRILEKRQIDGGDYLLATKESSNYPCLQVRVKPSLFGDRFTFHQDSTNPHFYSKSACYRYYPH